MLSRSRLVSLQIAKVQTVLVLTMLASPAYDTNADLTGIAAADIGEVLLARMTTGQHC